jgi:hypothetical protein
MSSVNLINDDITHKLLDLYIRNEKPGILTRTLNEPVEGDLYGRTYLHLLIFYGYSKTIKKFIKRENGGFFDTKDWFGVSALAMVCSRDEWDIAILLMYHGARVDETIFNMIMSYLDDLSFMFNSTCDEYLSSLSSDKDYAKKELCVKAVKLKCNYNKLNYALSRAKFDSSIEDLRCLV